MDIKTVTRIMDKYIECPICSNDKLGKNNGGLIIEENTFERNCRCGFRIIIDSDENVVLHHYESYGNTYCAKCGSKVEGGYCDCISKNMRGNK